MGKLVLVIILLLIIAIVLFGNQFLTPKLDFAKAKILPANNAFETVSRVQEIPVNNCQLNEERIEIVSKTIRFGINYELISDASRESEVQLANLSVSILDALGPVVDFFTNNFSENSLSLQFGEESSLSAELKVHGNEIRIYTIEWQEKWGLGYLAIPIEDYKDEAVQELIFASSSIKALLDKHLGGFIDLSYIIGTLKIEYERLITDNFIIPFRVPASLTIESLSYESKKCN